MACRCQERRDALKRASTAKTVKQVGKELKFIASTAAQDARQLLFRRKVQR